jgi:hypothetical protein
MMSDLEDKVLRRTMSYYIAFKPENFSVQAIGQFGFSEKDKSAKLFYLATNPKNLPLFKEDVPFRGGGSAILSHITREIQNSKKFKKLPFHLVSLPTAAEFYKKRGFKKIPSGQEENTTASAPNSVPATNAPLALQKQNIEETLTLQCGYETETEDEKSNATSDKSWRCICKKEHDPIRDNPDLNIEFSFPPKAQMRFLKKTKNIPSCKKISWQKLRSGV